MTDYSTYYDLKKKHEGFEKIMPEIQGIMFLALLDDKGWSWEGLAALIRAKFENDEIDNFVTCLKGIEDVSTD